MGVGRFDFTGGVEDDESAQIVEDRDLNFRRVAVRSQFQGSGKRSSRSKSPESMHVDQFLRSHEQFNTW